MILILSKLFYYFFDFLAFIFFLQFLHGELEYSQDDASAKHAAERQQVMHADGDMQVSIDELWSRWQISEGI